jgi:hypothetical protein
MYTPAWIGIAKDFQHIVKIFSYLSWCIAKVMSHARHHHSLHTPELWFVSYVGLSPCMYMPLAYMHTYTDVCWNTHARAHTTSNACTLVLCTHRSGAGASLAEVAAYRPRVNGAGAAHALACLGRLPPLPPQLDQQRRIRAELLAALLALAEAHGHLLLACPLHSVAQSRRQQRHAQRPCAPVPS